jgi:hypothetical protein
MRERGQSIGSVRVVEYREIYSVVQMVSNAERHSVLGLWMMGIRFGLLSRIVSPWSR